MSRESGRKALGIAVALVLLAGLASSLCLGAESPCWKAGTARTNITPAESLWMGGYAARTKPAEGKAMDLWLKALALEDARGHRVVIVTSDLLGLPQPIYRHASAALREKFGLEPEQIILSASHTHSGPVLRESAMDIYGLDENQRSLIGKYSAELEVKIVETAGRALAELGPARLAAGQGTAGFAVNRRNNPEPAVEQRIESGSLKGPTDHAVPVLAVFLPDGKLKAVLFGYACHNTVLDGYQWSGDYAGFAQLALEKSHPEATALFFNGCAGDQNPLPRRRAELAERYGNMLAAAVEEVLRSPPRALAPEVKTSMEMLPLPLGTPPTAAELEKVKDNKNPTAQRWSSRLLAEAQAGKSWPRTYPYPVQAWQFGGQQLLLTLGGEPVVDYALKFKQEFGPQTWVAGYCNEVMAYIPSRRVLKEDVPPLAEPRWGYEGSRSMMAYGLPAFRWADNVEDVISASVQRLVQQVRTAPAK